MGRFQGEEDGHVARQALLLLLASDAKPDAVLLIRDSDGHVDARSAGLKNARDSGTRDARPWPFAVAIGVAHTMRECWVLAGFEPEDVHERDALEEAHRQLGFDPRIEAERLRAKHEHDRLSAKRILRLLSGGSWEREEACWLRADLRVLSERGKSTGLREFLSEVRSRIVPLFTGDPGRPSTSRSALP
jgi:hypothetical protein